MALRSSRHQSTAHNVENIAPERNLAESPLAWLARRKDKDGQPMLADTEFDAGERLRADFWFAQMTPRVTANWSLLLSGGGGGRGSPDIGPDMRDSVVAARERVKRALTAVGPDLAGVLIGVCCHLKGLEASEKASGWPQRSGKIILQIALRQLARHYGMLPPVARTNEERPVRIRHWGTSDYRPEIEQGPA
ncbi:MAG: DUF6456 domain-containing protein [Hyphomicrobium sp.]